MNLTGKEENMAVEGGKSPYAELLAGRVRLRWAMPTAIRPERFTPIDGGIFPEELVIDVPTGEAPETLSQPKESKTAGY